MSALSPKFTRFASAPRQVRSARRCHKGFTLIELLVVMSVISVLMSLLLPALSKARTMARATVVMAGARQMGVAQAMYADRSNGYYIPEQGLSANPTFDVDGTDLTGTFGGATRWPLPFATLAGKEFHKGALFVNDGIQMLPGGAWYAPGNSFAGYYSRSLFPSFGLNSYFVGGTNSAPTAGQLAQLVRRPDMEAMRPSKLISFAKTRGYSGSDWGPAFGLAAGMLEPDGYFYVRPPMLNNGVPGWASTAFKESDVASTWGYMDLRYNDAGVPGFCDGHAELLSIAELRDMRLWSDQARRADDPEYTWTW